MTQTYAQRVAARPGYARFKNRKKELRRQLAAGRITADEHSYKLAEAAAVYREQHSDVSVLTPEEQAAADQHKAAHEGEHDQCTNDLCLTAKGRICRCPQCEGRWHGAAVGGKPLLGYLTRQCPECKRSFYVEDRSLRQKWCSRKCKNRARARAARKPPRRSCRVCGLRFNRRGTARVYCGIDCARTAHNARRRTAA